MNIIWFEMQNVKKIVITEIKFITITYGDKIRKTQTTTRRIS